jgi:biotin carboxylase
LATTTGYQTRAFGEAAERLGVDLVFATDRCHMLEDPWQDDAIAIRFYDEEQSALAIVGAARDRPFDGLLVVGDRPTVIAARAAAALGLSAHPAEAAAIARNKRLARERLRECGLSTPWFVAASIAASPRQLAQAVSYPCVIKPVALSGSRGVIRANDPEQFVAAFDRLRRLLEAPDIRAERNEAHDAVLVEGFIAGREYAVEGLLDHGTLEVLAIFDKPDPLDGPFFEETIYVTPSAAPASVQQAIVTTVERAVAAIALHHGPIHAECRVNAEGVFVLEVAARPIGGLCARSLRFDRSGTGIRDSQTPSTVSLEELLLRHALGEAPQAWEREADASGVMMIPIPRRGVFRQVEGIEEARRVPGVEDVRVTAKTDQLVVPLPEGASYLGFIFARGRRPGEVERALRAAHQCLTFTIDAELPVLART